LVEGGEGAMVEVADEEGSAFEAETVVKEKSPRSA
jgi:hypothetical protein